MVGGIKMSIVHAEVIVITGVEVAMRCRTVDVVIVGLECTIVARVDVVLVALNCNGLISITIIIVAKVNIAGSCTCDISCSGHALVKGRATVSFTGCDCAVTICCEGAIAADGIK